MNHEADFLPGNDPREESTWTRMSDEARAQAMAGYLFEQAAHH